jgi:hypothetical protein
MLGGRCGEGKKNRGAGGARLWGVVKFVNGAVRQKLLLLRCNKGLLWQGGKIVGGCPQLARPRPFLPPPRARNARARARFQLLRARGGPADYQSEGPAPKAQHLQRLGRHAADQRTRSGPAGRHSDPSSTDHPSAEPRRISVEYQHVAAKVARAWAIAWATYPPLVSSTATGVTSIIRVTSAGKAARSADRSIT